VADDDRNRFVEVPQRQSSDGWDVMRRFIDEAPDPRLRERLVRAIEGKGAFRRFKDELSRHPEARERWFAFEAGVKREWAEEWLREIGIESTWSPPARKQGAADWQPKVVGVHHVQITAPRGQEQAAREFYCGVLGLVEVQKPESLRGRGGLWVMAGEFEIHIGSEEGANRAATKAHVAYQVTDIAKWRDRLAKAGVEILDSVPVPGYERFEFRDPFGNRVEMIQERG
jgi:catechol 2,3-dioxygenase-like lactoylglutathione lyase family enzyme